MFVLYGICFFMMIYFIKSRYFIYFKTLTSLGFVLTAIYCAYISHNMHILIILLPGLIGCMIGDILLATKIKHQFLYGLSAFLLSNLYFIFYLYHFQSFQIQELLIPVLSMIVLIALDYLPHMDYKKYEKPIMLYTFVIAWAMSKSIMCYLSFQNTMFFYTMIGFILYYLSDFILLFHRFYETSYHSKLRLLNLFTYYLGLFSIAYSLIG